MKGWERTVYIFYVWILILLCGIFGAFRVQSLVLGLGLHHGLFALFGILMAIGLGARLRFCGLLAGWLGILFYGWSMYFFVKSENLTLQDGFLIFAIACFFALHVRVFFTTEFRKIHFIIEHGRKHA